MRFHHAAFSFALLVAACGSKQPEAPPTLPTVEAPKPKPAPAPHPTTEEGVLTAFTQALEQKDMEAVRRFLAPELGAELTRLLEQSPDQFWAGQSEWLSNAKTGLTLAARTEDASKGERWNALVRFGNGKEERVTFAKVDGKLVLADL